MARQISNRTIGFSSYGKNQGPSKGKESAIKRFRLMVGPSGLEYVNLNKETTHQLPPIMKGATKSLRRGVYPIYFG